MDPLDDDESGEEKKGGARERTHDVVEEIREEIGELVEHVPRSVRWTIGKIVRVALLALVGLVLLFLITAGLYAANRTQWVAQELALFLNQALALRSDVTLSIRDLKGNPASRMSAIEPSVRFRDGSLPPLLTAPSMTVGYSLWGFITGRPEVEIELESPVVTIAERDGMMRFPVWRSGRAGTAVTTFDIRMRIRNATVVLPDERRVEGLEVDAAVHTGKPTRVVLHGLSWTKGPYVERLDMARGQLTAADSITFVLEELRTPDLQMEAFGGWEAGATDEIKERHLHVKVERLRWGWLAELFRNSNLDVPGEGAAVVELFRETDGDMRGKFLTDVDWNGLEGGGSGEFEWSGNRVSLEGLEVSSRAGFFTGRFEMIGKAWDLAGNVRNGNPAEWGAFGLSGWPEGDLAGNFRYRTTASGAGHVVATLGASQIAGWDSDSARVEMRSWPAAPDSFDVWMHRGGGSVELHAFADAGEWQGDYRVVGFPLEEWKEGRESGLSGVLDDGEGTVHGRDGELHLTGWLAGSSTRWGGAEAGAWRIDDVRGRLLPTPDLDGTPRLTDVYFLGVHFDSLRGGVRLGDARCDLDSVTAFAGDTLVTLEGLAGWSAGGWRLEAPRARAVSTQFDWRTTAPLLISGDPRGVTFESVELADGEARLRASGRWASPGGRNDFRVEANGIHPGRVGLPEEWVLAGRVDAELTVSGPGDDPSWRFSGRAARAGARGVAADSITLGVQGTAGRLDVTEFAILQGDGRLSGNLRIDRTATPWPQSTGVEDLIRWVAGAGRWGGRIEAGQFPVGGWGPLIAGAGEVSGRASGTLHIRGRPNAPELEVALRAQPLVWRTYDVDDVVVRATYADGLLRVPELVLVRRDLRSSGNGAVPILLAVGEPVRMLERPVSFDLDMPNGDLAVLPLVVPQIGAAAGSFTMSASLRGTPSTPRLSGSLRVEQGRLRLAGREEEVHDVRASLTFDEGRVTLDSLTARQGRQGHAQATGFVMLDRLSIESYRFDLAVRDFTALESGVYSVTFDARFLVTDGERVHGQLLPHVVGEMEVLQSRILLDFANQAEMQQFMSSEQELFWTYRVQIRATNKLRWEPPNANVEFSADLTFEQSPDSLAIFGDVNALRGRYWFLSNRFEVRKANLAFDNVGGIDPVLDLEAETTLRPSLVAEGDQDRTAERVTVRITGRSRNPVLEFSSSPGDWDQPTILRELTLGNIMNERGELSGAAALGNPLDDYVTRAINRQLSVEMSKIFQGYVNEWTFRRESGGLFTGTGELYAEVGIPLSAEWQIRYSQRLPNMASGTTYNSGAAPLERDLEVEYRLSRFFFITSEILQRRSTSNSTAAQAGPEFNVNLKARWEY